MIEIWGDHIKDGTIAFEISSTDKKHRKEMLEQLFAECNFYRASTKEG